MGSLAEEMARLNPVTIDGVWRRHVSAAHRETALQGRSAPSRWGRRGGFPILYLGRPNDSVVVEAYRHLVDPVEDPALLAQVGPRVLVTTDSIRVTEILDMRTATARVALNLSMEILQSETSDREAYEKCRDIAAVAHQLGFHGIITPAATRLGETLALFTDLLPQEEVPTAASVDYWDKLPDDPRTRQRGHLSIVRDDS
jgi:hypothetical protein